MPWQLIYTSAPRGLLSGQSGFCTVARSGDLREALVQRLEQISSYHYLKIGDASRNPTVSAFRILDLRGTKYYVLTRIQPSGLDFTARTNHLAHHLIFQSNELPQLPSPAAILRFWGGWLLSWQGEPRLLPDPALNSFHAATRSSLPAQTWLSVTGDAGRAAGLLESEYVRGCYLLCPPGSEEQVLQMFCESLQLLNLNGQYALRPWRHTFTTFLQAEDNPADFQWRACQEDAPACQQAAQSTAALIPLRSVRVPANSLVKVARDGQKPSAPVTAGRAPVKLARHDEPAVESLPAAIPTSAPVWEEPVGRPKKRPFLDLNFSINAANLTRVSAIVLLLVILVMMKYRLGKKHLPPQNTIPNASVQSLPGANSTGNPDNAPITTVNNNPRHPAIPPPAEALDVTQLNFLSGDGPTYVFACSDPANFDLPIDSISRFQNLLHRFDQLELHPPDIQMSLNTDGWDFPSGSPLTVAARNSPMLSAQNATGLECSFDYSNWKNDPHNPVVVRVSFSSPAAAFSIHFGFAAPGNGEPFRLLVVNEINPPPPIRLGVQWLRGDHDSVAASLQTPLRERLLGGNFVPLGKWRWELEPFVRSADGLQTNFLYKDWPAEELPRLEDELDFSRVKTRLLALQKPFSERAANLAEKLAEQIREAALDTPLAKDFGIADTNLASFAAYTKEPATDDFLDYLNALKKRAKIDGWPHLAVDDDPAELEAKFGRIHDTWVRSVPAAEAKLTMDNTNYFSAVWQNLKIIEKTRQEKERARENIEKLQARLQLVPSTLDQVAYVGLFMIDKPRPGLEMIRFERH